MRSPRLYALLFATLLSAASFAQTGGRIALTPGDAQEQLNGSVHPDARAEFDRGAMAANIRLERLMLYLKPSAAQQADLEKFLADLQDPSSPDYHRFLTPEQYANRFSVSAADFNKVADWLTAQGFSIDERARGRSYIAFSGTVGQVAAAFHTSIHRYVVNGEAHYANSGEPQVPFAFANVVSGLRLHDFRPHARVTAVRKLSPNFTSSISGSHFVAPDDFATIYDLHSLYSAGIDGHGMKLVVIGQTDFNFNDIRAYRTNGGLPPSDPFVILVPGSTDPGVQSGDEVEADLDMEISGAVAPKANIIFVNAKNVFDSLQYAISQNLAPVISSSYGACETQFSATDLTALNSMGSQANAQGQTIVSASGDSGAADCDSGTATAPATTAKQGLVVDLPAGIASVTGVGGSTFNEGTNASLFWSPTNNTSNGSALSYIPEVAWNDTNATNGLEAGGGGKAKQTAKPAYQNALTPADNARDVPDVTLAGSPEHDGYLICAQGSCVNGYRDANQNLFVVGGTSAGAPAFSGMLALLVQKTNGLQGNVNPTLYSMATAKPNAFHDITTGNNKVPCTAGTTDCPSGTTSIGYDAGPGYDLVTGLGSVDAANLINQWTGISMGSATVAPDFQVSAARPALALTRGTSGTATVTVASFGSFSSSIAITCSVATTLTGVTCTPNPASVTGNTAVTLTVTAPAATASIEHTTPLRMWNATWAFAMVFGFAFTGAVRNRRRAALLLALLAVLAIVGFAGCGGGGSKSTPVASAPPQTTTAATPLSGNITITGTSGSTTRTATIAVTVN